jgi:hypothetical protein
MLKIRIAEGSIYSAPVSNYLFFVPLCHIVWSARIMEFVKVGASTAGPTHRNTNHF